MIEAAATRREVEPMVQASFGASDGETLWAVRYATSGPSRSLFASADADAGRRPHPENARFQRLTPDDSLIVSERSPTCPGLERDPAGLGRDRPRRRAGADTVPPSGGPAHDDRNEEDHVDGVRS
jgi:hypothetical protein